MAISLFGIQPIPICNQHKPRIVQRLFRIVVVEKEIVAAAQKLSQLRKIERSSQFTSTVSVVTNRRGSSSKCAVVDAISSTSASMSNTSALFHRSLRESPVQNRPSESLTTNPRSCNCPIHSWRTLHSRFILESQKEKTAAWARKPVVKWNQVSIFFQT